MKRKSLTILLLILVGGLSLVVFWLYKQVSLEKQNQAAQTLQVAQTPEYPYFPAKAETYLDAEKTWQRKSFQPIFKEFVEADNKRYLVVNYSTGASGTLEEGKIFVTRGIPYIDEQAKTTIIDSLTLKDKLKPGDRFGVDYLSQIPQDFSLKMPHCQNQAIECLLAAYKQESDKKGEKAFYAMFIYRILKK
ncbi:MAG: hypothetical protein NTZ93_04780 [Candidatus Beckwithbacteria bacterium]|nr:hypothetical protein [Candidatus Beckwithbacteria bacterium]